MSDEYHRILSSGRARTQTDETDPLVLCAVRGGPSESVLVPTLVANAVLSLLNVTCFFLDRQLAAQAAAFERKGGFTERLYNVRSRYRRGGKG